MFAVLLVCFTLLSLFVGGAGAVTYNGSCGDHLTWTLITETGLLEIDGTGNMTDYDYYPSTRPGWHQYRDNITKVILSSGVTSIGKYAFQDCRALQNVTIGNSVTSIGDNAFQWCTSLTSVVIPDGVKSIGNLAFDECHSLTSLTIGNGVTSLEGSAFQRCYSLTSLTIGNGVTSIGGSAFSQCTSLTSVIIPDSVTSIGYGAFSACSSLNSVEIPDSVTSIGQGAFSACSSLNSVEIPDSVMSIEQHAFLECDALTSVVIPDSVTSIGYGAFWDCDALKNLTIGNGVTSTGNRTFADCSNLTSVIIGNRVTSIGELAFDGCPALSNLTLPKGLTSIGNQAFQRCYSLTSVVLPDNVTSIGDYAFSYCSNLEAVDLENTTALSSVGTSSFGQNSLTAMKSGSFIYVSDERTAALFINGTNYYAPNTRIIVNGTVPEITYVIQYNANGGAGSMADQIFTYNETQALSFNTFVKNASIFSGWGVTADGSVIYTDGQSVRNLLDIDGAALTLYAVWTPDQAATYNGTCGDNLTWNLTMETGLLAIDGTGNMTDYDIRGTPWHQYRNNITNITLSSGATSIGKYAFYDCLALKNVTIGNSVTSIGWFAFNNCRSLTSVALPDSVTSIGLSAFGNCLSLTSVVIPDSVTSIGALAFDECHSLTSVIIPDNVTSIEVAAFQRCYSLTSLTIGNGVTSIGDNAFSFCSNLEIVDLINTTALSSVGPSAFGSNSDNAMKSGSVIYVSDEDAAALFINGTNYYAPNTTINVGEDPDMPLSSLQLIEGWNFISVPKTLNASNNTAGSLFGKVETSDKSILGYNTQTGTWVPITDEMEIIHPLNGYWIYAAAGTAINLTYPSTPTPASQKPLYPGWNAVGLSSGKNTAAHNALSCLGDSWKTVIPWDLAAGMYHPAIINGGSGTYSPDRLMTLGNGYWIYVDSQNTLVGLAS